MVIWEFEKLRQICLRVQNDTVHFSKKILSSEDTDLQSTTILLKRIILLKRSGTMMKEGKQRKGGKKERKKGEKDKKIN